MSDEERWGWGWLYEQMGITPRALLPRYFREAPRC